MPVSGTGMRTVSPEKVRAVRSLGRGGALLSGAEECTEMVTEPEPMLPKLSSTLNTARTVMGDEGAW